MRLGRVAIATAAAIAAVASFAGIVLSAYGANPGRRNDATTVAYLRARASFLRIGARDVIDGDARLRTLVREVSARCANVVAASPLEPELVSKRRTGGASRTSFLTSDRALLVDQVATAVEVALRQPRAGAFARFAAAVRRLRWQSKAAQRRVRTSVDEEARAQRRTIGDLCGEMRVWVNSDYKLLPSGVRRGRPKIVGGSINGPLPNLRALFWPGALQTYSLLGELEPFLGARQKSKLRIVRRLQTKLIFDEMRAVKQPKSEILHALGFYSQGALYGKTEASTP